ncbi:predicted protein [Naegleria gruberi]|uniref:Predicted protein n=1 Tax=Naegleria gruberi TaxID=5762 RepID=D2VTC6_NAEGR|nr:uncharacterized protein NAEGRDRAFT_72252 [Naegleria gruberi]EFC39907.1 predicted protein [Naegleria gruberi]|eukprot:XP_002672651.1 predicted protein [Naegleria gruberi strain NEG-M]
MSFYTKCGHPELAMEEFEKLKKTGGVDIGSWNCLLQAYISAGNISTAIQTFTTMQGNNISPNDIKFTILLKGCADNRLYEEGVEIHRMIPDVIENITTELATSIMNFYTKCGKPYVAVDLYDEFCEAGLVNVGTCTALIQAFIEIGDANEAFTVFNEMLKQNFQPNIVTYLVLLQACSRFVSTDSGNRVIKHIQDNGLYNNEIIQSSIALYFSKIGELEASKQIFDELLKYEKALSIETCNNILSVFAHHGEGSEAFNFYISFIEKNIEPTEKTFTILLNALSHSGMVEHVYSVFSSIKHPSIHNKCAMVDALARKGLLEQAESVIDHDDSYILWNTLMCGCRKFNNLELGERVFKIMISIDELEPSAYLLSHIYMNYGLVEKANKIRELMKEKGIQVMPGIVYHEENGITYKFVSGNDNFDRFNEVEQMRDEIFRKIIKAGYVPDVRWVPNTEFKTKDERVKALLRHSEKTAIAHAFVLNKDRKKILLTTNLRVCNDCHSATAFISKVMDCEIIVRDAKRFHHFKNGICSCNNYW